MKSMDERTRCKLCKAPAGRLTYRLREADVFVCAHCGFHYTTHLDSLDAISSEVAPSCLTDKERCYIASQLESHPQRFENQVRVVQQYVDVRGRRLLDIGCGGGRFLSLIKSRGALAVGLELSDVRIQYARSVYGLDVWKYPVDHAFWQEGHREAFDVLTLWDVLEHVNFPDEMLHSAGRLLKPGGLLFIDTPCRDAMLHRLGALCTRLTFGRLPLFLNVMYSDRPFGHKQIFATGELARLLEAQGFDILAVERFHELSFPHRYYLKRILRSNAAVAMAHPFVKLAFKVIPLTNKMMVVARRKHAGTSLPPSHR